MTKPSAPSESTTLASLFLDRVAQTPDATAFLSPAGGGQFQPLSWRQTAEIVRRVAGGLRAFGLVPEERCAIIAQTRLEWILADLGILCAGGATTTVYPSNTAEECAFVLHDADVVLAFVEDQQQLQKLRAQRDHLPALRQVILLDGAGDGDWVLGWDELLSRGGDLSDPSPFETVARAVRPEQLATLVYTSGTTGQPKGVELSHDAWVYEAEAIDQLGLLQRDDLHYLWLPLSHVFGKVLQAAQLRIGFPTAVDGRVDQLVDNLARLRPTFVAAVPRIFEKIHNKILTGVAPGWRQELFHKALALAKERDRRRFAKEPVGLPLTLLSRLAERLVFAKLVARFGGRLRFFVSGSAPLAPEIAAFFHAAGVLICEGYGLTESSAASFVNRPERYKLGSVGLPLPGTEVRIAPDGEILLRGRGIMRGYHNRPEATAEVLDPEGWLHTGDIGHLDDEGFLHITDRKKDLIKTSGGKYIAPQPLEGKLKALSPYISQVLVHGDNRNYATALLTLDEEAVRGWAAAQGLQGLGWEQLVARPEVQALVQTAIDQLNRDLARYETVKKFAIVARDFSQEAGELTASMKIKRKVVEAHYREVLDGLYSPRTP